MLSTENQVKKEEKEEEEEEEHQQKTEPSVSQENQLKILVQHLLYEVQSLKSINENLRISKLEMCLEMNLLKQNMRTAKQYYDLVKCKDKGYVYARSECKYAVSVLRKSLHKWEAKLETFWECQVCQSKDKEIFFIPCGHGICFECEKGLKPNPRCHRCDAIIRKTIHTT